MRSTMARALLHLGILRLGRPATGSRLSALVAMHADAEQLACRPTMYKPMHLHAGTERPPQSASRLRSGAPGPASPSYSSYPEARSSTPIHAQLRGRSHGVQLQPAEAAGRSRRSPATRARGSSQDGDPLVVASPWPSASSDAEWVSHTVYRGRGMPLFRAIVRLKLLQLASIGSGGLLLASVLSQEAPTALQIGVCGGVVVGAVGASVALWYYSRRYVGEIQLLTPRKTAAKPTHVRLSVLDFWGNRENNVFPLQDVHPPRPSGLSAEDRAAYLLPLPVAQSRQFYISWRLGRVDDAKALATLLTTPHPRAW